MLKNMPVMQGERASKREISEKNKRPAKRTTIVFGKEREFIDTLIKDGKEPGIKPSYF